MPNRAFTVPVQQERIPITLRCLLKNKTIGLLQNFRCSSPFFVLLFALFRHHLCSAAPAVFSAVGKEDCMRLSETERFILF
jgi:hypothetical protein